MVFVRTATSNKELFGNDLVFVCTLHTHSLTARHDITQKKNTPQPYMYVCTDHNAAAAVAAAQTAVV